MRTYKDHHLQDHQHKPLVNSFVNAWAMYLDAADPSPNRSYYMGRGRGLQRALHYLGVGIEDVRQLQEYAAGLVRDRHH